MRIFLAFPLPEEVKAVARKAVSQLVKSFPKLPVLWIRDENLHVSMEFLGDINQAQLLVFNDIIHDEVSKTPAFEFQLGKLDCVPDFIKPQVLILRVKEKDGNVSYELRRRIQQRLIANKIPPDEKSWIPHITIGRIKKPSELNVNFFEQYSVDGTAWKAEQLDLYNSTLTPEGAIYEMLKTFPLMK